MSEFLTMAKANDVPTYVEYGAADIGICGKDTILEEGRKLYEVLDLGFGRCRMCVCGPESARELLRHHELIRVATKYPAIAKDYFYNKKHQTVAPPFGRTAWKFWRKSALCPPESS